MLEPVKVLMLNYEYPPLGGGAGNATAYLLRELSAVEDVSVTLVTSSTSSSRVETLSKRIRIHFLDIAKKGSSHYQTNRDLLTYSWKAFRLCRKLIRSDSYHLCHAFFGIPCGFIAQRLKVPYVVSLRGSDVPFYNKRFRVADKLLFRRLSVRIWRDAEAVVANSNGLRSLALRSSPHQPISVIPNGVDVDEFKPEPSEQITPGVNILCVSRLIARKRIDTLLEALALIRDASVSLTLVGTGNEETRLRKMVEQLNLASRVQFKGSVCHEKIVQEYQQGSLFVLPSENEGMSNTILEAMACGLPILMSNTGGAEELIRDGTNGFVLQSDSPTEIAERIRFYCENPASLSVHGRASRQIAESLSWRAVADAYVDVYRTVVKNALSSRHTEKRRQGH